MELATERADPGSMFSIDRQEEVAPRPLPRPAKGATESANRLLMAPKEHGTYAELVFPLVTAVALGGVGTASWLFVLATVAAFLAHEPLVILAGERGRRAQAQLRGRAWRGAAVLSLLALVAGVLGWWSAPAPARAAVLAPLLLAAPLVPFIVGHREKSLAGELLVALTFSSALLPVALAGGVDLRSAVIAVAAWSVIFALQTLAVRAVVASPKQTMNGRKPVSPNLLIIFAASAFVFVLAAAGVLPAPAAAALVPSVLIAVACNRLGVHPRHLRTMGWSLVAGNLFALAMLLIGLT